MYNSLIVPYISRMAVPQCGSGEVGVRCSVHHPGLPRVGPVQAGVPLPALAPGWHSHLRHVWCPA